MFRGFKPSRDGLKDSRDKPATGQPVCVGETGEIGDVRDKTRGSRRINGNVTVCRRLVAYVTGESA